MEKLKGLAAGLLVAAFMAASAYAANVWPDADGNNFGGDVVICLDRTTKAVPCGQVASTTATITNGTSLSAAVDLGIGSMRLVRIVIPVAGWTAANLTFQTSFDCTTYGNLRDAGGSEYTVTVSTAGDEIIIPYVDFIGVRCLKVRSGTSGVPVNQGADRTLRLVIIP